RASAPWRSGRRTASKSPGGSLGTGDPGETGTLKPRRRHPRAFTRGCLVFPDQPQVGQRWSGWSDLPCERGALNRPSTSPSETQSPTGFDPDSPLATATQPVAVEVVACGARAAPSDESVKSAGPVGATVATPGPAGVARVCLGTY